MQVYGHRERERERERDSERDTLIVFSLPVFCISFLRCRRLFYSLWLCHLLTILTYVLTGRCDSIVLNISINSFYRQRLSPHLSLKIIFCKMDNTLCCNSFSLLLLNLKNESLVNGRGISLYYFSLLWIWSKRAIMFKAAITVIWLYQIEKHSVHCF